ncbi:Bcr/CflA family efflux MFS transporter [Siculibacillus lacustris]|uniref:Bcr/CflA family efflux transporter n=1 Tax=Siculibacillus lacustris TaxID=1549641 RepID=A0A4Q9VXK1_9HYPH|nr:multidrug effflux MFS transporter [Siculibacillus lacustris]TBW41219.1 Bcr/CflA family efflux MFS transporter [Siculibacillus lacustris]
MFRPDTLALTGLLALLASIGPVSTDIFLPSLPTIRAAFATDLPSVQLTLSIFMIGFAVGQIVFGPLSDRRGRKPVLLGTLGLYLIGSLACTIAPDIGTMLAGRLVQAIGAAGPIVLARSIVRDLYNGPRAALELGRMGLIVGVVPSFAPLLGGVLEAQAGWRASFALMVIFAVIALVAVRWRLPETVRQRLAEPFTVGVVVGGFGVLLANRRFRSAVLLNSLGFGGIFAFISGSSFILQGAYGLDAVAYGVCFGLGAGAIMAGNFFGQRMTRRLGVPRMMRLGTSLMAIGGVAMAVLVTVSPLLPIRLGAAEVVAPYMVFMFGLGPLFPLAMMRAMEPFPDRAGSASSLLGCLQLGFGAAVGVGIGHALEIWPTAVPLALVLAVLGLGAVVVERATAGRSSPTPPSPAA